MDIVRYFLRLFIKNEENSSSCSETEIDENDDYVLINYVISGSEYIIKNDDNSCNDICDGSSAIKKTVIENDVVDDDNDSVNDYDPKHMNRKNYNTKRKKQKKLIKIKTN